MARIPSGHLLKGARGRIGNFVTYDLNGVQVVRSLPTDSRKKKASKLQLLHRSSFKMQHAIAHSLKHSIISRIWSKLDLKGGMNAYNQFIKTNRAAYGQSGQIMFPELMVISQGALHPVQGLQISRNGDYLHLTWDKQGFGRFATTTDRLNLVILENRKNFKNLENSAIRQDGTAEINLTGFQDNVIEGYIFWSSYNDQDFSPSVFWTCNP